MVKFKKKKFTQSQLFARLDAEGKGEEARAFFEQVYSDEMRKRRRYRGVKAKIASDIAVIATAKKFPPDPRAEWRIKMAKEREHELVVKGRECQAQGQTTIRGQAQGPAGGGEGLAGLVCRAGFEG